VTEWLKVLLSKSSVPARVPRVRIPPSPPCTVHGFADEFKRLISRPRFILEVMQDSIFTKIIKGEIPCHKVYEDDKTLAFMDIEPLLPGHVLVVPKIQVDQFDDLPDDDYRALFAAVKKVSKRVKEAMKAERAIVVILGFDIPHAHVHVIPANDSLSFLRAQAAVLDAREKDRTSLEPDHTALAALAKKLAF
jgi:histidine triad (HIT) family protein